MQLIELIKTNEEISKNCLKKYSADEINYQDKNGDTPLHWAIRLNNRNFINHLLNNKFINVNIQNTIGVTPLIEAIMNDDDETATLLIIPTTKSKSIFLQNIDKQDALMLLIKKKKWEMVKMVFKKIASIINNPIYIKHIFHKILINHQWELIELMLKLANYDLINTNGIEIILTCAAKEKQWDFIERMLKKIDIWKQNFDSFQAVIILATYGKKWIIVNELIKKLDPNTNLNLNNISDLFNLILQNKKWDICSKLINKISFESMDPWLFNSISIEAINNGQLGIIHHLLDKVLNDKVGEINDKFRNMPLYLAIILKEEEIALNLISEMPLEQLVLDSKYGLLTLRLAALHNMINVAYKIIEILPLNNINFQDENGETFLHWALKYSKLEFIKMIKCVTNGDIDFNIKDENGVAIGSLLNDETIEIFKVDKIKDSYIEFNFANLDEKNISNNWKKIKAILLQLNEIIDQIDNIENNSEFINKIVSLAISEQVITFIQENILKTNNQLLKQKLQLYCDNVIKIIDLKTKVTADDEKELNPENGLNSEVTNLKPVHQSYNKQTENLTGVFSKKRSYKNCKSTQTKSFKNSSFIDSNKDTSANHKSRSSSSQTGARPKKNRVFNHRYQQINIDEINKSISWLKKHELRVNIKKPQTPQADINKFKDDSSCLAGCNLWSNYETAVQLQKQSDKSIKQRLLIAHNILSSIYIIFRSNDLDHELGRPAIIIGRDIKNDTAILVLVGTTKVRDGHNFTKIIQLRLNDDTVETSFYDNGFKWVNSNDIGDKWSTQVKLNIDQKQIISQYLSNCQLAKLTKEY